MPFDLQSAEYREAFATYVRTGFTGGLVALDPDNLQRGGYLAPPQFVAGLSHGPDTLFFRRLAEVRPATDRTSVTQASRQTVAQVFWAEFLPDPAGLAEAGFRTGSFTLRPRYLSGQVLIDKPLLATAGNEGVVVGEVLAAAGKVEERAFVAGSGRGEPLGVFTPSEDGIPESRDVVGTLGLDVFVTALTSLPAVHLRSPSLRWLMSPQALAALLRVKATTGQPIVEAATEPGGKPTVVGVAVELTDDAPAGTGPGGAYQAGDYLAAVGDLSSYTIQDGPDQGVKRHDDAAFNARNQTLFIARRKVDGAPRLPAAFARVKLS